jgi:hypothetical protein
MAQYPKVEKTLSRLSQDDSLLNTTIQLVTGAFLSAGLLIVGSNSAEAKPVEVSVISAPSNQGSAIVLTPGNGTKSGSAFLAGHYSHSSHASHASHASHHSHYSSR